MTDRIVPIGVVAAILVAGGAMLAAAQTAPQADAPTAPEAGAEAATGGAAAGTTADAAITGRAGGGRRWAPSVPTARPTSSRPPTATHRSCGTRSTRSSRAA